MASATDPRSKSDAAGGLSLRTKWTLSVLGVALVPMLVVGAVVLRLQRDGLAIIERQLEAAIVDEASSHVDRMLADAASVADETAALLFADDAPADVRLRRIEAEASRVATVRAVSFFDAAGTFIDAVVVRDEDDATLRTPPEHEGFAHVVSGAGTQLRFARRVTAAPGGWVVVALSPPVLGEQLRGLSAARFGVGDRLYVLDEDGAVIAGGPAGTSARPALFAAVPGASAAFTAPLAFTLTAEFDDHGTAKVGTIRILPAARVAVAVERPDVEAFATLTRTRHVLVAGLLVFAGIAAAVGTSLARRALAPVQSLMRLVRRYARRELSARSEVRSRDELQALGESLEQMADELSASELEIARRARVEADLARYLPADVAKSIDGERRLALGGVRRSVTVLFADVVAFTGFAESTSPERVVAFLNELFTLLSEIVFRHGGTIDKFIGDCVMALFDDESADADGHATRALRAAEDMHRFVASTKRRWNDDYGIEVRLGIGVATGDALVGNLGSELRMEYTAIGDIVNVAARLESLARPDQTLTTVAVAAACPEFEFASLGEHPIRGRAAALEVLEVVP